MNDNVIQGMEEVREQLLRQFPRFLKTVENEDVLNKHVELLAEVTFVVSGTLINGAFVDISHTITTNPHYVSEPLEDWFQLNVIEPTCHEVEKCLEDLASLDVEFSHICIVRFLIK